MPANKCEQWRDGGCQVVAELTGLDVTQCEAGLDACAVCLASERPKQLNSVTASLGIMAATRHLEPDAFAAVRATLAPHLEVVRPRPTLAGPGTELKKLLSWLGIHATPTCACNARARDMDLRGCDWCEANQGEILAWLREEAGRRGLPFVELMAAGLVRLAIRRARAGE